MTKAPIRTATGLTEYFCMNGMAARVGLPEEFGLDFMLLAVRFVVPIRNARSVTDEVIRRIHTSLDHAGVETVATSVIQNASTDWQPVTPTPEHTGSGDTHTSTAEGDAP